MAINLANALARIEFFKHNLHHRPQEQQQQEEAEASTARRALSAALSKKKMMDKLKYTKIGTKCSKIH